MLSRSQQSSNRKIKLDWVTLHEYFRVHFMRHWHLVQICTYSVKGFHKVNKLHEHLSTQIQCQTFGTNTDFGSGGPSDSGFMDSLQRLRNTKKASFCSMWANAPTASGLSDTSSSGLCWGAVCVEIIWVNHIYWAPGSDITFCWTFWIASVGQICTLRVTGFPFILDSSWPFAILQNFGLSSSIFLIKTPTHRYQLLSMLILLVITGLYTPAHMLRVLVF